MRRRPWRCGWRRLQRSGRPISNTTPALTNLRFALDRRSDGNYVVRISSAQPVNEPYLDVMVELTWATGRVIREYTVLLDPPALKSQPDIVAPAAPAAPVAAAPVPPCPPRALPRRPRPRLRRSAAPPAAPAPSLAPAPKATPAPSTASGGSYTVKSGDTLGKIANQNRSAASLDQMLVALFRANPEAFINKNMNLLRAGAQLSIPTDAEAAAVSAPDARREVVAQSADFAAYRSRLAQAAGGAAPVAKAPSAAAGGGQVTTKVEDRSATAKPGGDQLKIAKADDKATAAAAAAAKADEAAAKARAREGRAGARRAAEEDERGDPEGARSTEQGRRAGAEAGGTGQGSSGRRAAAARPGRGSAGADSGAGCGCTGADTAAPAPPAPSR